jgi:hypothetical protein
VRKISNIKTPDAKGNMVGRITPEQYETIYKLSVIAGFFEDDETLKRKVNNLFFHFSFLWYSG